MNLAALVQGARPLLKQSMQLACSGPALSTVICWRGLRSSKRVSLTFDDGPDPTYTPRVMELLARHGVRATFFVLGERIRMFPGLVREMAAAGHEIGIHGWDHTHHDLPGQTERTRELLGELGIDARLFRPPHGYWSSGLLFWMKRRRYPMVLWSVDSLDSAREKGIAAERPSSYDALDGGDIVLFHDDNDFCLGDLPVVIDIATERGLLLEPVSSLTGAGALLDDPALARSRRALTGLSRRAA